VAEPILSDTDAATSLAQRIIMDNDRAQVVQAQWLNTFERVFELVAPERNDEAQRNPDSMYSKVWDSSPIEAAQQLTNLLVSGLFPPWTPWFMLVPGALVQGEQREAMSRALFFVNQQLFLQLNLSNLIPEVQATFLDLTVGTGAIMQQPRKGGDGLEFGNIPIEQLAILRNAVGEITHTFRTYEYPAVELLQLFKDKFSQMFLDELNKDISRTYDVVEAIIATDKRDKFWHYLILRHPDEQTDNRPVMLTAKELGYNPIKIPRWAPIPGQPYGRGPAMMSFGDIRSLNKIKELYLKNAWKAVAGIYTGRDDGILNPYNTVLKPGTIIPVASNDTNNLSLREIPQSGRFEVAEFGIKDLRDSIRKAFLADQFSPVEGTKMSALEIAQRGRAIAQNLGATYAGLQNDLLVPIVKDSLTILQKQNKLPKGFTIDRELVDVVFLSQIAQAQRLTEVDAMLQFATISQQLASTDPRAALLIDVDKFQRRAAELLSVDKNLLKSKAQVEEEIDELREQLQPEGEPNATQAPTGSVPTQLAVAG